MTNFRELLHDVADQAEPIDDLAGRALRQRPQSRPTPVVFAAAASVVVVLALAVVGIRVLDNSGSESDHETITTGPDGSLTVRFPETAQPLPDKGVGPALLSYQMSCNDADGNRRDCDNWRVVTTDGQHYDVEETTDPGDPRDLAGPELAISPDGDRIAHLREDGAFVMRELESGQITTLFEWDPNVFYSHTFSYAWSSDGRWLYVVPGADACPPDPDGNGCRRYNVDEQSMLVDTETGDAVPVGYGRGSAYGLPDGNRPFPFGGGGNVGTGLPLVDHDGEVVGEISYELMPGRNVDGMLANISPDGQTLPVITFPKDKASDVDGGRPLVTVVDVENERILRDFRIERGWKVWDSPDFMGWQDNSTVLIETSYLKDQLKEGTRPDPGDGVPVNVDALDVETGELHRVLRLPNLPWGLHVAYNQL